MLVHQRVMILDDFGMAKVKLPLPQVNDTVYQGASRVIGPMFDDYKLS